MAWEKFEYAKTDTTLPAYILVVDELAEFVDSGDRSLMKYIDKFQENLQSIARLGRSAHVHLVLATQSASSNLFPSSLKNNIAFRNICGRVEANISRMAIDSEEGEAIPLMPGSYLGYTKGETQSYRGWYTPTKKVLALGTVKEGYDPETGLEITNEEDDDFDLSMPIEEETINEDSKETKKEEVKEEKDEDDFVITDDFFDIFKDDDDDFEEEEEEETEEKSKIDELFGIDEKENDNDKIKINKPNNSSKLKLNKNSNSTNNSKKLKLNTKSSNKSKKESSSGSITII